MLLRVGIVLTVLLVLAPLARTAAPPSARGVAVPGAGVALSGVLLQPSGPASSLPALLVFHGTDASTASDSSRAVAVGRALALEAYAALVLPMRGWPPSGGTDDCGQKQPDDAVTALEWLADQPGVDPTRTAVMGLARGGQVALLAASRSRRVKTVVAVSPVVDVDRWIRTTSSPAVRERVAPLCETGGTADRSPLRVADRIEAPVLLMHGMLDTLVPSEQSVMMRDAMLLARRQVTLLLVAGAAHDFTDEQWARVWPTVLQFLNEHLKKR